MSDNGMGHVDGMPGDVHGSDVFYMGQCVPFPPDVMGAGPLLSVHAMPPLSSDLETFRDDLYSGRGYEHTPIAKYIIKLLGVYVRRRAEDSLYDPTLPLPISPPISRSSQEPGPVEVMPSGLETALHTCKWQGCGLRIDATPKSVKTHMREHHFADIPIPIQEWETSKVRVACQWAECKALLYARSIPKHVTGVHLSSSAVRCPVEGCDEALSRGDALKRHVKQKHPEK